jgi:FlaA1/EpsC-like NDP-sugar epimerase
MYQFISGQFTATQLKDVDYVDLLGREPINVDLTHVFESLRGKTILITGGGGSIGSELCRQIAASKAVKRLIIFDVAENGAYNIQQELKGCYPDVELITLIGTVRDEGRLDEVFKEYRPDIIYHAAAHKHVPLMETSPKEAIKNNVFGTLRLAKAADKYGALCFVMISTDKAVNPTNVMGASKRVCEMIIQAFNKTSKTNFVAVRFGNVLGSNGSVIPLFKEQIKNGGPVTVTHPDIIRYFMLIPEAVALVLKAGCTAKGGEIFVLDMGTPVKIAELAENMIKLSGYKLNVDIEVKFTGLREGEKLYEELLIDDEGITKTEDDLIYIAKPTDIDNVGLFTKLAELEDNIENISKFDIIDRIADIVSTYHANNSEYNEYKQGVGIID